MEKLKYMFLYCDPFKAWINVALMAVACYTSFWLMDNVNDPQIIRVASASYIVYCVPFGYDYLLRIKYQPDSLSLNRGILTIITAACFIPAIFALLATINPSPPVFTLIAYRCSTLFLAIINGFDAVLISFFIPFQPEDRKTNDIAELRRNKFNEGFNKEIMEKGEEQKEKGEEQKEKGEEQKEKEEEQKEKGEKQ